VPLNSALVNDAKQVEATVDEGTVKYLPVLSTGSVMVVLFIISSFIQKKRDDKPHRRKRHLT